MKHNSISLRIRLEWSGIMWIQCTLSLQLPSHKDLIQKVLPADFSSKEDLKQEDFNEGEISLNMLIVSLLRSSVGAGLYTRLQAEELRAWILSHGHRASWRWVDLLWKQRNCEAQTQEMWLGSVSWQHQAWRGEELCTFSLNLYDNLKVNLCKDQVEDLLQGMRENGFSSSDYDVFQNSCNTFTEVTLD